MKRELLYEKVIAAAKEHAMFPPEAKRVAVAVSGGADSVCLLHALHALKDELGLELSVAHLNHGIRGADADGDEEFTSDLAKMLGLPFYSEKIDVPALVRSGGPSLEQLCRAQRIEFYRSARETLGAQRVALAHTMSDQAETVLMRVMRGTSLRGVAAMAFVSGHIVRPILAASRDEVREYCRANSIEFREDITNSDERFVRNRVRHSLIPELKKSFNPNVEKAIFDLAQLAAVDSAFLDSLAADAFEAARVPGGAGKDISLKISGIEPLPDAILSRVLVMGFYETTGSEGPNLEDKHVREMIYSVRHGKIGRVNFLPGGAGFQRSYETVVFRPCNFGAHSEVFEYSIQMPSRDESVNLKFDPPGIEFYISYIERADDSIFKNTNQSVAYIDAEKLDGELKLRSPRSGDYFRPLGMKGEKKLQDFFTDEKVPAWLRKSTPVLLCRGRIVWLAGLRLDERFKVTDETTSIIKMTVKIRQ